MLLRYLSFSSQVPKGLNIKHAIICLIRNQAVAGTMNSMTKKKLLAVLAVIIAFTFFTGCLGGSSEGESDGETNKEYSTRADGVWGPENGHTNEGEDTIVDITFNHQFITEVTFVLTWVDTNDNGDEEAASDDVFTVSAGPPNGTEEGGSGSGGQLQFTVRSGIHREEPVDNNAGWKLTINIEPGEGTTAPAFGVLVWWEDTGNDWQLSATYSYLVAPEAEE